MICLLLRPCAFAIGVALFLLLAARGVAAQAILAPDSGPDLPATPVADQGEAARDEPIAGGVPGPVDTSGRDLALEAHALELAGFRALAVVVITSEPPGAAVTVGEQTSCVTPCRLSLPPGRYRISFAHEDLETIGTLAEVTIHEQLQVHAELGRQTPWDFILPTYVVGGIFTAGGVSALLLYGSKTGPLDVGQSDVPADERRFHRNLGIASLAIGVPLLGLASYLLATGRPGEVRTSVAPLSPELALGPTIDLLGRLSGAGIVGTF
jgi:hypothetical protein